MGAQVLPGHVEHPHRDGLGSSSPGPRSSRLHLRLDWRPLEHPVRPPRLEAAALAEQVGVSGVTDVAIRQGRAT
jgi:hypothetical protein